MVDHEVGEVQENPVTDGFGWEYKIAAIDIAAAGSGIAELNQLGAEGWELVQVLGETTAARKRVLCVFKRPKVRPAA